MRASDRFIKGLIYFPLKTNLLSNEKIKILISEHEKDGFACLIILWCQIYGNDYYKKFTIREKKLFCNDFKFKLSDLELILETCFTEEIFDRKMYDTYAILTSDSIQEIWIDITYRRKELNIIKEFFLLDINNITNNKRVKLSDLNNQPVEFEKRQPIPKHNQSKKQDNPKNGTFIKMPQMLGPGVITADHYRDHVLEKKVLEFFGFNEIANPERHILFVHFLTVMKKNNILELFKKQFENYSIYKANKQFMHSFDNFLGAQSEAFKNGNWNSENWELKASSKNHKENNNVSQKTIPAATRPFGKL